MSGDTQILREYLVALGFRVNEAESRKFDNKLIGLDKNSARLGKTLVGVATAAVTLTTLFARSMEKMYYSARYIDTTVGSLQAMEFAGKNAGLAGGAMTASLKSMAAAIRANPGLVGLLNNLGIPVKGRTMDKVMLDFVKATKSMPSYVAQQYAAMFGMDPETLFNMQQGLDVMEKAAEKRKEMAAELGVDADKTAEMAKEYMNMWRDVTERAGLFGQAIGELVMPEVQKLVATTSDLMKDWVHIAREINSTGTSDFWKKIREGTGLERPDGGVRLTDESTKRLNMDPHYDPVLGHVPRWKRILRKMAPNGYFGGPKALDGEETTNPGVDMPIDGAPRRGPTVVGGDAAALDGEEGTNPGVDTPTDDPRAYLAALERRYNLPPGLLDRTWNQESGRGKNMLSPKKAKGHFGFMDNTAKEYGLKDPNDFEESADAAARKWSDLLKRYGGDARKAAAAYNWGDGNLAKYGLGNAPAETRGYMDKVAGPASVTVAPEIHIHGVSDPERAADSVVRKQREVAGDVVRNLGPKVR